MFLEASAARPWQILHMNDPALRITGAPHVARTSALGWGFVAQRYA